MKAHKRAVSKITLLLVSVILVLLLVVGAFDLIPHSTKNNSTTQTSQHTYSVTNTSSGNLASSILLNNLATSQNSYMIYNVLKIESSGNASLVGIIVWAVNHTSGITINSTTAFIQTHYNSCAMQTYGSPIQWPVASNYPYPVTVYAGYVAGTPDTPSQNYFVVGYVSDGIPYIIYSSAANTTRSIVVSDQLSSNGSCV